MRGPLLLLLGLVASTAGLASAEDPVVHELLQMGDHASPDFQCRAGPDGPVVPAPEPLPPFTQLAGCWHDPPFFTASVGDVLRIRNGALYTPHKAVGLGPVVYDALLAPAVNGNDPGHGGWQDFVLTKPGEWRFHCGLHPEMTGATMIVTD